MKFYNNTDLEVFKEISSSPIGLSNDEANDRLTKNGKNKLAEGKKKSIVRRFLEQLIDPMIIVLLCAALVSGILAVIEGDSFTDVIIILVVVLINAILGVAQESKAEKAIEALQKMSKAQSKVLRDGKMQVINSEDLVVGDIVMLEAGDAVPADGRIINCASLQIEEAALTGESVPVNKTSDVLNTSDDKDIPLGDRKNMVYMGSTVVYGRGTFVVCGTGMNTEMGKIASALSQAEEGETPLQKKLGELSKILTFAVLGICVVVFVVQLIKHGSFEFEPIMNSFMIAVSLAVAAIPEGLAAVVTVVLSIGVTNMSKRNAIIRKLTAVETLGCAQIICSDKTGTLTQNKMTVVDHFGDDENKLATEMALCTDAELNTDNTVEGEPTEAALVAYAAKLNLKKYELKEQYKRVAEAPFDSNRKMMTTIHQDGNNYLQCTKGAPDVVISRCSTYLKNGEILPLTDEVKQSIYASNKSMADRALRVLACAEKHLESIPNCDDLETLENNLCFVGLTGMIDPVRPEVVVAIQECKSAGIRPIMITGDHIDTAVAIAIELGILNDGQKAITGSMLSEMSDEEFENVFRDISVYARVQPEHKTRIVNAWRKAGFVTAMTGDGVNDAPSIKSADIGVGMGITGTDVTKSVADMVLADDNFATIVGAVEEGRRIYDNIQKAIQFLLSSNMSEVITIFVTSLMGFTVLKPVHLLWINLITDTFPALGLGMEKAEPDVMNRKPRSTKEGIFSNGLGFGVIYQGLLVSILVIASYFAGVYLETGSIQFIDCDRGMTMAFITMSMAEIFHSFNMRSKDKSLFSVKGINKVLLISAIASLALTTLVCEVPFISNLFGFVNVTIKEYAIAIILAVIVIPVVEIVKLITRLTKKNK